MLKLLRLSEVRLEQSKNIQYIAVTFAVLKEVRSRDDKAIQSWNIWCIDVTLLVLKWLRSTDVNFLHEVNISLMFVTWLVFRYSMPVMEVRFVIEQNHSKVLVGRALANEASKTTEVIFVAPGPFHLGASVPVFKRRVLPVRVLRRLS